MGEIVKAIQIVHTPYRQISKGPKTESAWHSSKTGMGLMKKTQACNVKKEVLLKYLKVVDLRSEQLL